MVRKSHGNSEPERIKENIFGERKNTISNFSRSIKMLESDQMRDIVPYVRTYILFWVTTQYKNHDPDTGYQV